MPKPLAETHVTRDIISVRLPENHITLRIFALQAPVRTNISGPKTSGVYDCGRYYYYKTVPLPIIVLPSSCAEEPIRLAMNLPKAGHAD